MGFTFDEPVLSFSHWVADVLLNAPKEITESVAASCFTIWKSRNLACFEEKETHVPVAVSHTFTDLAEYKFQQQVAIHGTAHDVQGLVGNRRWRSPPWDKFKVNVDAGNKLKGGDMV